MVGLFSSGVEAAIRASLLAHEGQTRKGDPIPYVSHPYHVALLLARSGADDETIQAGLLSSCRAACPQCKKKVETCQTTCKQSKAVNVCKKTCTKEIETSEKFCFKPCLKYGKYEHCEDDYCPKSTYGKRVCDKPCVRYEATATKWCQPKCEAVQCKELCTYKPKETCTKYAEECKAEQ